MARLLTTSSRAIFVLPARRGGEVLSGSNHKKDFLAVIA
jgi:hypothetical protein